ncbi:sodium:calcium antiporter [Marinilabiliaceae bacterium JC017]|nr:sodium:calcium antiporter [Marinilabiliaceae bacterium JC017]
MEIFNLFFHTWYGGLALMVICSIVIAKACDVFEASTEYLGRNMNEGVKGATLNAIGSSMPEFLTTVFFLGFALSQDLGRDFAASIGGDTGSAIFNSVIIPMLVIWVVLASGIAGVSVSKKVILRDGLFLICAEVLLLVLLSSNYITYWHGLIFTGFYAIYLGYTLLSMKKNEPSEDEEEEEEPEAWFEKFLFKSESGRTGRSWLLLIVSTMIIALSCAGLVEGCKGISTSFGINPLFVALILVAAASSVPDTIISIRDARKGNHDDALSNVLGSNIFDITISMGLPLAIFLFVTNQKIDFSQAGPTLIDIRIMLLLVTMVTIAIFYFSKKMTARSVIVLGVLYGIFILYGIGAAEYHAGGDSILAQSAGSFIDYLRQPGGIGEMLQKTANAITSGW